MKAANPKAYSQAARVLCIWCRTAWVCVTFMLLLAALVDWKTLLSTAPDPPNVANAGIYRHSYVQRDTAVWLTSDTVSVCMAV